MKVVSLFTGIGGFDLGFEQAGMKTTVQVEIDPKCRQVLESHFPDAIRFDDIRSVTADDIGTPDLICGGFPCQDVSIAGHRAGLAGERSGLWREFVRILGECPPSWVVIENVPGLLSSNGGRDMGTILRTLGNLGYGFAYRVLDSQWFGLAQRRKRVFIVGSIGDWRSPARVLFEPESSGGNPEESREKRKNPSQTVEGAPEKGGGPVADRGIVSSLNAIPFVKSKRAQSNTDDETWMSERPAPTLNAWDNKGESRATVLIPSDVGVRTLTPKECEMLQGFPLNWTAGLAKTNRYRMLGNAVSVPVSRWLGERIISVQNAS